MIKRLIPLKQATHQKGLIMVTVVVFTGALLVIGLALLSATTGQYQVATNSTFVNNSLLAAEAGVEQSVQALNASDSFSGYASEQEFFNNSTQGRGTFTVSIAASPGDSNAKIITATGKVYRYNSSEVVSTRIVKVTAVGTQSEGYSVYAGPGGLILSGSGAALNADMYVNGKLTMSGGARIGSQTQPVNLMVANQACPTGASPGPTYPEVCSTGQPINLSGSATIYGTVCATGQTSANGSGSSKILPGNGGGGLQIGCVAPPIPQPTYDRAAHIASVASTFSSTDNTVACTGWPFTRTWSANIKFTGNMNIGSACDITIRGNVYITGNLDLGGSAKIRVDNSVGTTRPVIMVDGKITVGGSAEVVPNSSGTSIDFYSFKSSASCSPNCTSVTGNDLKTSSALETVSIGGGPKIAGTVFNAYWGKATVGGSGNVGAAIGQTVDLSGGGTLTFGVTLASGTRTWTITSYQQKYPGQP